MKPKEEWRGSAKNKGEPLAPLSFLFEPRRGDRVGSPRRPIFRPRRLSGEDRNTATGRKRPHKTTVR